MTNFKKILVASAIVVSIAAPKFAFAQALSGSTPNVNSTQSGTWSVGATQVGTWGVGLTFNGTAVATGNPLGMSDIALDALIVSSRLNVATGAGLAGASTAVSAANVALAVGLSPNSPLPAGTNALGSVSVSNTVNTADTQLDAIISGGKLSVAAGTVGITSGGNQAAVTAASTAAVAANPALVVALSPATPLPAGTNALGSVTVSNFPGTQAVTGTFFQATQPVSATSLPLPAGAATSALQPAINADGGAQVHIQNTIATSNTLPSSTATTASIAPTITTANTYQTLFSAASISKGCYIQNPQYLVGTSTVNTAILYVDWKGTTGTTLATTAQQVPPGSAINCTFIPATAVTVYSATTFTFIAGQY